MIVVARRRGAPAAEARVPMSMTFAVLIGLPGALSVLTLGLDRYLRSYPRRVDDLWRLPKPSSRR